MDGEVEICARCGAPLRPTLRFCTECGQTAAPITTYAELIRPAATAAGARTTITLMPPAETAEARPAPAAPGGSGRRWRTLAGSLGIFGGLIALLLLASGVGFFFRVSSEPLPLVVVALARDSTPDFHPIDQTRSFAPSAPAFHLTFYVSGAGPNDALKAVWIAVDVGDSAPRKTRIDEATIELGAGEEWGAFRLQRGASPWPVGEYKVELYVNDRLSQSVAFTVDPETATGDANPSVPGRRLPP